MSQLSDRRSFLAACAAIGAGTTLFPRVLWARIASGAEITTQVVADAEQLTGVEFNDAQRQMLVDTLKGRRTIQESDDRPRDATVVQRLDAAGAILVAKLTLGELAQRRCLVR